MNERSIFIEALEKNSPAERSAYLDESCASDTPLRLRVESLLKSHLEASTFLEVTVPARLAEESVASEGPLAGDDDAPSLAFLAPSDKPGSLGRLGHYEVLEIIGHGGFGIVVRAFDETLHRVVAIKVMAPELAATSPPRKRFLREARAAAAIRHDNIVSIYSVEESPIPYLVMEYIDGQTLQQKLDATGPLDVPEVRRLGQQIAAGLAAAHAMGLTHRDIKPGNILLEKGIEQRVKITDFGLARAADDASLTRSGVIAGTPMYMAPEQASGESIDHRADLFSLGSVLYVMVSGRPPFRGSSAVAVLKRVVEDTPRPLQEIIPETPQWLCDVITTLHAKNPADRIQSAAAAAEQLRGESAPPQPSVAPLARGKQASLSLPAQGRRRWAMAAAVLLPLLGVLSLTEAAGVTNFRATVIRIFTPDGTLVVEVDDPAVKVTIEGDGGLVIAGAGAQEVRVKPGSYKVQATKDDKPVPVDQELVTITRGGKQVVKVSRDSTTSKVEQLNNAREEYDLANRLYIRGDGLRSNDPWEAEKSLRQALTLFEKLAAGSAGSAQSERNLRRCRWALGSALQAQAKLIVIPKQPPATVVEARRAISLANEAIALVPEDMGMRISLGAAHYRAGDWQSALAALEKADLHRDADGAPVDHDCMNWLFLAMVHWQLGDKEQARHWLGRADQSIEANKRTDEILHRLRAEALELLGISPEERIQLARNAVLEVELAGYDAALKENPNDLATLLKRGNVLRLLKRFDDSVAALSLVIINASDPSQRASALKTRAMTHAERGHLQGTIEDYEEYVRPGSEEAWIYGRLATCYTFGPEKLRNPQRALERAETAIQKRDANLSFHTLHGVCLYRQGRHRDAIEVLERTYEGKDHTAMNRFFAAMTYQNLGDPAKAQQCYALALKLPQPTGHPDMIPDWVELMRAEAEAVLKIPAKK